MRLVHCVYHDEFLLDRSIKKIINDRTPLSFDLYTSLESIIKMT